MKALITGAAGFIGSNLVKRLDCEGIDFDMVDDMSNGHLHFVEKYIKNHNFYRMDFADEIVLSKVSSNEYDVVFHQAAIPFVEYSVDNPYKTTNINLLGGIKLLEALRGTKTRLVFASSSSVYGNAKEMPTTEDCELNPVSPYALQKKHMEEYAKVFHDLFGLDSVCLRYFNVYGPGQYGGSAYSCAVSAWCDAVKHGKNLRSDGDGEQTRDLCFVENVVDANMLVAFSDKSFAGDQYNVATGESVSNNQILEKFKERFGDKINIVHAPERPGDVKHTKANIDKIKELGYEPSVNFWDGLEKTFDWWGI